MNIEERIARLEGFMNKFEEERIRSEERTRIEIELAEARLKKMRRMWEFFKGSTEPDHCRRCDGNSHAVHTKMKIRIRKSRSEANRAAFYRQLFLRGPMGDILNALKIGELMTADDLTWQATAILVVLIAFGVAVVACVAGKAVKIWRDALK